MAYKLDGAPEGFSPSLNIFQTPPCQTSIYGREWVSYRPVSQISKGSPIQFRIGGTSSAYKDLRKMLLYVKVRILKPDGQRITKDDPVGFSNLALHSLFKQVDLTLQQQPVSTGVALNYAYKAMIDTLIKYDLEPKVTQKQSALYFKDTAGYMDSSNPYEAENVGLLERAQLTQSGDYIELLGPLFCDLTQQKRLLLNGVEIGLKLTPNADGFALMSSTSGYTYEIGEAVLKVCHVKLNPGVLISHAETLKRSPALYPYMKSDIRTFNIAPGTYTWSMDDIFQGVIPSRLIVALVSSQAYSGEYNKNPFNFQHFNVNHMGFYVDGQSMPSQPFACNYKSSNYVDAYLSLFSALGKMNEDEGNMISRKDFGKGYAIYVFDVTGRQGKDYLDLTKKGQTRLSIRFDHAPGETLTALVYSSFPALFQIDESRSVIL